MTPLTPFCRSLPLQPGRRTNRRLAGAVQIGIGVMCVSLSSVVSGQVESSNDKGYDVSLFDGSNLDSWKILGCRVETVDESLRLVEGNGLVHTHAMYRDFILELEWRPLKESEWDSGIYFRANLPAEGRPWPRRYQINLKQGGEGDLIGFPEAKNSSLVRAGEWNHMRLVVRGTSAALELNGEPAWHVDGIEQEIGYVGIQSEVPLGGSFDFRNVRISELGHRSLFNATNLEGWEGADGDSTSSWDVHESQLRCTGERGSWLRCQESVGDFNLRLEYKLQAGGNSGVYLRVPDDGNHHGPDSGIEVQILDDRDPRYAELQPYQFTGSLYAIIPAMSLPGRGPGQWNHLEIDCRGHSYRVWLNGTLVIETDESATAALSERRLRGRLGLQNHNEEVLFRHLRIGDSMQSD